MIRYVLPRVLIYIASSTELLVLFSIAFAVGFAAFSDLIGFSKEVGAFLGGIALASSQYREAIGSRLTSVRDFLLLFFFISLGSQLNIADLGIQLPMALLLSAFVLIGNPLIVLTIMGLMGFRKRTGFLSGLAVAQISEFSLILAALGLALGHISGETAGLITLVALITIATSTYMIIYSHKIYDFLAPVLSLFERKMPFQEERLESGDSTDRPNIVVFGLGRLGKNLALDLKEKGNKVLGIDFDPIVINKWTLNDIQVLYGDAEDPGFLLSIPFEKVQWVVSTIPEKQINKILIDALRAEGYEGRIAVTLHRRVQKSELGLREDDVILLPYQQAALQTALMISESSARK
ncbi:MAG: cation:proton antiporter [Nitrincola sp.]|nr:cation:proton antiporter [Nitrincola sp.]